MYKLKMDTNETESGKKLDAGTEVVLRKMDYGTLNNMREQTNKYIKEHGDLADGEIPRDVAVNLLKKLVVSPSELKQEQYIDKLSIPDFKGIIEELTNISGLKKKIEKT